MNWKEDPRWAYVFVNVSTLLWSSNMVLGRALRNDVGPLTLAATRYTIAGLLFGLLIRRSVRRDLPLRRDWHLLALMGLIGIFAFTALLYLGLSRTTATSAALINGATPLVTALLATLLLRERPTRWHILGALVSLVGVGLIVTGGSAQVFRQGNFNSGDLIVLVAVGLWALYSVISRVATRSRSAVSASAYSVWFALPWLYPTAAFEWGLRPPSLTWPVILAAIYIGIFPSVIALLAWNEGVRRVGPGRAMIFYNMLPVYAVLLGVLFLHEVPGWAQLLGGGLVIAGSLASVWPELVKTPALPCPAG